MLWKTLVVIKLCSVIALTTICRKPAFAFVQVRRFSPHSAAATATDLLTSSQLQLAKGDRKREAPLDSWSLAGDNDFGILTKALQVSQIASEKIRGITATGPISEKDVIVTVPASLALETANNRPPSPFPTFISQSIWEKCLWDQRLAFKLLHLQFGAQTDVSPATRYWLKQLPLEYSTPYYWSDTALADLQYLSLTTKIQKQRENWKALYDTCAASSKEFKDAVSIRDFVLALECVNSRAFSGAYEGSSASERRAVLLFTGLLTLLWPLVGLGTPEQAISAAVTVGLSIVARDVILSKSLGLKRYVVCPYIDMFNHDSRLGSRSEVSYNYFQDQFEVITKRAYDKGEQVFISYGKQSNDRFLQYYGFVEADNPNDSYDFGVNIIELLLRFGDQLKEVVPFPESPSPTDRLRTLASALRATPIQNIQQGANNINNNDESFVKQNVDGDTSAVTADMLPAKLLRRAVDMNSANLDSGAAYFDDTTVRVLRGFFASAADWQRFVTMSDVDLVMNLGSPSALLGATAAESEALVRRTLKAIVTLELDSMPTSLQDDISELTSLRNNGSKSKGANKKGFATQQQPVSEPAGNEASTGSSWDPSGTFKDNYIAALTFRIEKKKLLNSVLND